jgi:site-specific DNA recombinase
MPTSVPQSHKPRKSPRHIANKASTPQETLRLAFYARVSSDEQEKKNTIEAQLTLLRKWAEALGHRVVAEYMDDPCSGLIPLRERPDGTRLLQDAQAGAFDIVVCAKIDRLSRSLWELLAAHRTLEACGVGIKSATEPIDTSDPIGRFLFHLLGSMAELDRERVLEQLSRGRDRVNRAGEWTNGPIPLGYTIKGQKDRRLRESTRMLEKTGLTESAFILDLFQRIAGG